MKCFRIVVLCLCLIFLGSNFMQAGLAAPVINAIETSTAPKLDGILDDVCWQNCEEYTGFVDSKTGRLAYPQTSVRLCYDQKNIYVAIHALHPNPRSIKAAETKRNGNFSSDDFVQVCIDSTHNHRSVSSFSTNAIGTQSENIETTSSTKVEWKGDWNTASKIISDGYNVEMAIPFTMLLYDRQQDTFGIYFIRNYDNGQLASTWPDLSGRGDPIYAADWVGIHLPKNKPRPILMGYVLGTSGSGVSKTEQGLDLRYPFSNDSTALVSIHPDFGNVEQNVQSVDFSYTEQYQSDNRPFFQEWGLPIDGRIFYSRRVTENFDIGTRFSGKKGPDTFGIMNINTFGERNDTIFAYSRTIGDRSGLQFGLGDHHLPGHRNLAIGYAGWVGWRDKKRNHEVSGGITTSSTTDSFIVPDRPGGQMRFIHYQTWGGDGDIGGYIDYGHIDKNFDGELGYTPDWGVYGAMISLWRDKAYRGGNLESISTQFYAAKWNEISGSPYARSLSLSSSFNYVSGRRISFALSKSGFHEFKDWTPSIGYSWNNNRLNRNGELSISSGRKAGGSYISFTLGQKFKLNEKLVLGASMHEEHIGGTSPYAGIRRQMVATLNYNLSPERSIGGRMVIQSDSQDIYLIYSQQLRHGMDIYCIYGDPNSNQMTNKFSLKLVRPF